MRSAAAPYGEVPARAIERSQAGERGKDMKLHEALRKVIRHFGVNVIEEKRLMSFLADYKAFDDYPAVKEVMRAIATGDSGKKICLAADGSDEEFLRLASEIKEKLVSERSFKEEFARYAVDSVSFALGIVSSVTEPSDHGYEAVRKDTVSQHVITGKYTSWQPCVAAGSSSHSFTVSGDTWQTASDGAESHRRFYRGHDLTSAFDSGVFSRNVADGSFRDIFPGDYIIRKITVPAVANLKTSTYDVKFIIADLDIAMNQGSPTVTAHHAVIVPEKSVFSAYMNPTDTNAGGYAGSYMHKTVMPAFAQGLIGAFGDKHLLKSSFDDSDMASSAPLACICRLMTLSMIVGEDSWSGDDGLSYYFSKDSCLGGAQLAAFRLNPDLRGKDMWWASDLPSSHPIEPLDYIADFFGNRARCLSRYWWSENRNKLFASIGDGQCPNASNKSGGVRPFALLV